MGHMGKYDKFKLEFIDRGRYFSHMGHSTGSKRKSCVCSGAAIKGEINYLKGQTFFQFCSSVNQKDHYQVTSVTGDLKILVRSIMEGMWQPDLICEGY